MSNNSDDHGLNSSHGGSTSKATSNRGLNAETTVSKIETVVFSVLYTMVKDNSSSKPLLRLGIIVIDTLQIIGLVFSSDVDWGSSALERLRSVNDPFGLVHLSFFFVIYGLVLLALAVSFFNFYFVARDLMKGELTWIWPVKTLRILCTLNVTVFYMPILNVLLLFLSCEPGENEESATLRSYPELTCWGSTVLAPSILACLALAVFVPTAIVFRFVFFNPDPISNDPLARPLARTETAWLFLKTSLVFLFRLTNMPTTQAVMLIVLSFLMLACQVVYMPVYKRMTNHCLAAAYAVDMGAGVTMLLAALDVPPAALWTTASLTGVLLATLGVALSEFRWRRLVKQALVASASAQQALLDGPDADAGFSGKQSVLDLISSTKKGSIVSSSEAQLYARVLLNSTVLNDDVADRVEEMLKYAVETFPRDASLLVTYANFLNHFRRNPQLATVQNRQISKLSPAFDVRFLAYCADRVSFEENKARSIGEGRLDVLTFLEFQKMFSQTTRYHRETLQHMKNFWRALFSDSVDVTELRRLTSLISTAENKASNAYQQILKSFPHNKQIYRSAASFMANVHHDYDMAVYYEEQADELESEKDGSGKGSGIKGSTGQSAGLEWSHYKENEESIQEHRGYRENLKSRRSAAVERLAKVGTTSLFLLCILSVVVFVVVFLLLEDYKRILLIMDEAGSRRNAVQISLEAVTEMIIACNINSTSFYNRNTAVLDATMKYLSDHHQNLYLRSFGTISDAVDEEWEDLQLLFESPIPNASSFYTNQKDGATIYLLLGRDIAALPMEDFYSALPLIDTFFMNGFGSILTPYQRGLPSGDRVPDPQLANSFERTAYLVSEQAQADVMITFVVQMALFGFALVTILLLGFAFFRPALNAVKQERVDTFSLFLTIPKDVVRQVHEKIVFIDTGTSAKKKSAKSNDRGTTRREGSEQSAEDAVDRRFRRQLCTSLVVIALLFAVTALVTSISLVEAKDTTVERNNGGRRLYLIDRVVMLGLSLLSVARKDPAVSRLGSFEELREEMKVTLDTLALTHRVVMSGGEDVDGRTMKGVGTRDVRQADLSNKEVCLFNPEPCPIEDPEFKGLEMIFQHFLKAGRDLADLPEEVFSQPGRPQQLYEVFRVKDYLLAGMEMSTNFIVEDALALANRGKTNSAILMSVTVVIIFLLFVGLFRPILFHLREESYRTSALLLLIPPEAITEVECVRHFLETGEILDDGRRMYSKVDEMEGKSGPSRPAQSSMLASGEGGRQTLDDLAALGLSFVVVDYHSTIIECSDGFLRETMYDEADVVGSSLSMLFVPTAPGSPKASQEEEAPFTPAPADPGVSAEEEMQDLSRTHAKAILEHSGRRDAAHPPPPHPCVRIKTKFGALTADIRVVGITWNSMPAAVAVVERVCPCNRLEESYSESSSVDFEFDRTGSTRLDSAISKTGLIASPRRSGLLSPPRLTASTSVPLRRGGATPLATTPPPVTARISPPATARARSPPGTARDRSPPAVPRPRSAPFLSRLPQANTDGHQSDQLSPPPLTHRARPSPPPPASLPQSSSQRRRAERGWTDVTSERRRR